MKLLRYEVHGCEKPAQKPPVYMGAGQRARLGIESLGLQEQRTVSAEVSRR